MQGIAGAEGQEISAKANVGYNDKEGTSWCTGISYINRGLRGMDFMYQKGTSWYAFLNYQKTSWYEKNRTR